MEKTFQLFIDPWIQKKQFSFIMMFLNEFLGGML